MHKLSIIVPAYNAQATLPMCIDSILAQTFANYEVIIVVQKCPDKTLDTAMEYAKRDNRIRVVPSDERGEKEARNCGLDNVIGEFFGFVDADDTISPDMFKKLIEAIELNNADIAMCEYEIESKQDDKTIWAPYHSISSHAPIANNKQKMLSYVYGVKPPFSGKPIICNVVWNKLYRTAKLGHLRIPKEQHFAIDRCFNAEAFTVAASICYVPEVLYQYKYYASSLSRQIADDDGLKNLTVCNYLHALAKRYNQPQEIHEAIDAYYMSLLVDILLLKIRRRKSISDALNDNHFRALLKKYPSGHPMFSEVTRRGRVAWFLIRRRLGFPLRVMFKFYFYVKGT